MDDAEAEVALLTLGTRFEWIESDRGEDDTWEGRPVDDVDWEEASYTIAPDMEEPNIFRALFALFGSHEEAAPMPFDSIAAAKVACEIHAATGQFPPGVKPELAKEKNDDCNV